MSITSGLSEMEHGGQGRRRWQKSIISSCHANLHPSKSRMKHESGGSINWLDLDRTEGRYLLSASSNSTLAIWDTQHELDEDSDLIPVAFLPRSTAGHPSGHRFSVTCCQWWTDHGLFTTASDDTVRLYDTNSLTPVCTFSGLQGKVTICKTSRAPGSSPLIAAASFGANHFRLADARTGAFTHSMIGHDSPVLALDWSLSKEHEILSGDKSGKVHAWDIRRPAALRSLDQFETNKLNNHGKPSIEGDNSSNKLKKPRLDSSTRAISAPSAAQAHQGPIYSLVPHPNHLMWISYGGDQRLRLWEGYDLQQPCFNLLVNYPVLPSTPSQLKSKQIAFSTCGQTLFVPTSTGVMVIEALTGRLIKNLKVDAHSIGTHSIAYNSLDQSVWQGLEDGKIVTWRSKGPSS